MIRPLKKLTGKKFCLWMVAPGGTGQVKKLRFSLLTAVGIVLFLITVFSALAFTASDYLRVQIARLKEGYSYSKLWSSHVQLQTEKEELTSLVNQLKEAKGELEGSQEEVRARISELQSILKGVSEAGIWEDPEEGLLDGISGIGGAEDGDSLDEEYEHESTIEISSDEHGSVMFGKFPDLSNSPKPKAPVFSNKTIKIDSNDLVFDTGIGGAESVITENTKSRWYQNSQNNKEINLTASALNRYNTTTQSLDDGDYLVEKLDRLIISLRQVPLGFPGAGHINSDFGPRRSPFSGRIRKHEGVDLALPHGSYIQATADGVVHSVKRHGSYGLVVDIKHSNKVITRYAHLSDVLVNEGEKICRGEYVGLVGSTGRSTGPHLHYEVRVKGKAIDPSPLMAIPDQISF